MSYLRVCALVALAVAILFVGSSFLLVSSQAGSSLVPHSPMVTALDVGTVSLDWNDVPNATAYALRYRDTEWQPLPHGDIRVTMQGSSAVVHGLPSGSEYAFAVRTLVANGTWSDWSEPVYDVALPARTPLARPTNLTVTKREPGSVTLDWHGTAPVNSYQVSYWHTSEAGEEWTILPDAGVQVSMDSSDGSSAVVSQLPEAPGRIHRFAVRAFTKGGFSDWSEALQAPAYLQAPQDLTGWFREPGLVELDWQDVLGADSYQVLYWHITEATTQWSILPVAGVQVSIDGSGALVDLPLGSSDMILSFSVRAVNEIGQSAWSRVTEVISSLGTPEGLSGQLHHDDTLTLDWHDVTAAHTYEVRFRQATESGFQWVILPAAGVQVSVDGSSASLNQLPFYNTFSFQVRARAGNSFVSDWSETVTVSNQGNVTVVTLQQVPTPPALSSTATLSPTPTPALQQGAATAVEPTPTPEPTRRSSSSQDRSSTDVQPTATPQPRIWLSPNPKSVSLKKDEWKKFAVRSVGIAAAQEIVVSIGITDTPAKDMEPDEEKGRIAFSFTNDSEKLTAVTGCARSGSSYQENFHNQGMGEYIFHLGGCEEGSVRISVDVYRFTGNAGTHPEPLRVVEYDITVEPSDN